MRPDDEAGAALAMATLSTAPCADEIMDHANTYICIISPPIDTPCMEEVK